MPKMNPLEIVIHPDNVPGFITYAKFIQRYVDTHQPIPSMLIRDFFELIKSKKRYHSLTLNKESDRQAAIAIKRLSVWIKRSC